ncbi:GNAT family N-acetyltransferase [Actinomadura scrupuli]|uniref:GNAT family N-acetyltransferase n=1 Tax=Actinomadura scrupuli TaxID=559629 RepID=UPI003D975BD1
MTEVIRRAEPKDLALLPGIENSGDRVFREVGIVFPPGPTVIEEAARTGAEILVAGDPPVGFAAVIELDGRPHLEQIAVRPDHGRRGVGAALLGAVRDGRDGITLITFRDVPWNGPWYARHGFAELPEAAWGPELRAHWQAEIDAGLHRLGPRLVMAAVPGP